MVLCELPSRRRGVTARRAALGAALTVALLAAASCSPIEGYRNLTGISKNDPNPATTPNTKNLAAGEAQNYPNLATVPPPPSQALTTAQLDKLTQSLIADRTNAKYTSEQLRAGSDQAGAAPPPPPPPTPAAGEAKATGGGTNSGPPPPSAGQAAATNATPAGGASAAARASAASPSSKSASGPNRRSPGSSAAAAGATGMRKSGQPPEPGPMESSLQSPQIASLPQPEAVQPAPPPPPQLTMPPAAPGPNARPSAAARLPGPPAPAPLPPEIGSAKFQPAPPPPNLPPPAPVRTATATGAPKPERPPPPPTAYAHVADIGFAADSAALGDAARQTIGEIVPRYRAKPGMVRVVGYAGVGSSATQQLSSYRMALDRAHAVAGALTKAGIPADKIEVEAAPVGGDSGHGRAEILLQQ